jgi:hypothetical protein
VPFVYEGNCYLLISICQLFNWRQAVVTRAYGSFSYSKSAKQVVQNKGEKEKCKLRKTKPRII